MAAADAAKIGVVERDPTEQGDRRLLNFGHTLGHALESTGGYAGLRHGEAVGYGLLFALRLSLSRGLGRGTAERVRDLLARFGLPPLPTGLATEELLAHMARDKKARETGLVWVLARSLGEGFMTADVPWQEVEKELRGFLHAPWSLSA